MYTQTCMRERLICIALYGTLNYLHSLLFISGTSIAKTINSHCQYTLKKNYLLYIYKSVILMYGRVSVTLMDGRVSATLMDGQISAILMEELCEQIT